MLVECSTCGLRYDDENRWTICPHGPLWAPSEAYCREHDLINCTLHGDSESQRRDSRAARTEVS